MSWHSEDWVGFVFSLVKWLLSVFGEAHQYEQSNGGGPVTRVVDAAKNEKANGDKLV